MAFKPNPTDIISSLDTKGTTDAAFLENITPNLTFENPETVEAAETDAEALEGDVESSGDVVAEVATVEVKGGVEAPGEAPVAEGETEEEVEAVEEPEVVVNGIVSPELTPLPDDPSELTVAELEVLLDERGVRAPTSARKGDLINLLLAWKED